MTVKWRLGPAALPSDRMLSVYRVRWPFEQLPSPRLVLTTSARVFRREVTLAIEREPDRSRVIPGWRTSSCLRWVHADQDTPAPALTLPIRPIDAKELLVIVDEGDKQPAAAGISPAAVAVCTGCGCSASAALPSALRMAATIRRHPAHPPRSVGAAAHWSGRHRRRSWCGTGGTACGDLGADVAARVLGCAGGCGARAHDAPRPTHAEGGRRARPRVGCSVRLQPDLGPRLTLASRGNPAASRAGRMSARAPATSESRIAPDSWSGRSHGNAGRMNQRAGLDAASGRRRAHRRLDLRLIERRDVGKCLDQCSDMP